MNLSDIANIVEIVGIMAILYGLFFGAVQLRQHRAQRRDLAILECIRLFENEEFTEAYRLIQELPSGVTGKQLDEHDAQYRSAAMRIMMKFEAIGMLVHRGVIPLDAADDLVGGAVIAVWGKLQAFIRETREKSTNPFFVEWFQWLVDRLKERQEVDREPAFLAHAEWSEPKA
jgi:hypothetical protein